MKENINISDYAGLINEELRDGILLNTNGDKFNSMVIGWGHIGIIWEIPTFAVYVRQSRYTKAQLDKTEEFTISVPLEGKISPEVFEAFGSKSGRDIDKASLVTLEEARTNHTPGIREYPLTIECEVIYTQDQDLSKINPELRDAFYGDGNDFHTAYIGKIVDAYIIKED
ncbi:MAG: flavin reductase [Erysipelotrichaceae bacterium]|nr:flavin reductase [Erysipelotrichaceae bacterium]